MNTRVYRLSLTTIPDIQGAIVSTCEAQLVEGFKLVTAFVWDLGLVMIFQRNTATAPAEKPE